MDVVVTVPKNFTHPDAPGKKGLAAWLAEGDPPGTEWSGKYWGFSTWGQEPWIVPGERVYVVCEGRLVGYSPLVELEFHPQRGDLGRVIFWRAGGAVACTIPTPIVGFRGWKCRWWERSQEVPIQPTLPSDLFAGSA